MVALKVVSWNVGHLCPVDVAVQRVVLLWIMLDKVKQKTTSVSIGEIFGV